MYFTEREFLIVFPSEPEVNGFVTSKQEVIETFSKLFEEYWNRAKPIEEYLDKYS